MVRRCLLPGLVVCFSLCLGCHEPGSPREQKGIADQVGGFEVRAASPQHAESAEDKALLALVTDALLTDDVGSLRKRLADHPEAIGHQFQGGWTMLHYAARFGATNCTAWLLENGASPNCPNDATSATPLHIAALNGDAGLVGVLLAHGADTHARTNDGSTPADFAKARNNAAAARLLGGSARARG